MPLRVGMQDGQLCFRDDEEEENIQSSNPFHLTLNPLLKLSNESTCQSPEEHFKWARLQARGAVLKSLRGRVNDKESKAMEAAGIGS